MRGIRARIARLERQLPPTKKLYFCVLFGNKQVNPDKCPHKKFEGDGFARICYLHCDKCNGICLEEEKSEKRI